MTPQGISDSIDDKWDKWIQEDIFKVLPVNRGYSMSSENKIFQINEC